MQRELDEFKNMVWNTHRIRYQRDTYMADGIPNHIYAFPEQYGLENCGKIIKYKYDQLKNPNRSSLIILDKGTHSNLIHIQYWKLLKQPGVQVVDNVY